jgi:hypothetical protein
MGEPDVGFGFVVMMARCLAFLLAAAGCHGPASSGGAVEAPSGPAAALALPDELAAIVEVGDGVTRRAVVAGLARLDPQAWGGWDGACPGADVDAWVLGSLCRERGIATTVLQDAEATRGNVLAAGRRAAAGMRAGDLLVLVYSGHGGQRQDVSGDEADGRDETICLWDGEWTDDQIGALLADVPAGVRVLFITDSCNSGTNYRERRSYRRAVRGFAGELIHFGGCADGESSIGTEQGGWFTTALIDGFAPGRSYREWFDAAVAAMPRGIRRQVPTWEVFGAGAGFVGSEALR